MISFSQMHRLCVIFKGTYKNVLPKRIQIENINKSWLNSTQICHISQETEENITIEKPKRPLHPFFQYLIQVRPTERAKYPELSEKDLVKSISEKYNSQVDPKNKSLLKEKYEREMKDYHIQYKIYKATTVDSKPDKKNKESKKNKDRKAEQKIMGRPKKPFNAFLLFAYSQEYGPEILSKEILAKAKVDWDKIPESERTKHQTKANELLDKYREDLQAWEKKMISEGRNDLVRIETRRKMNKSRISDSDQRIVDIL